MWDLITVGTQWTQYIKKLLERMSIGGTAPSTGGDVLEILEVYPCRISDISLPDNDSGFVYFLVLVKDCGRTYVGQTKNILRHLKEHNKGWGAMGTAEPQYRPYAVAAYTCGMPHIDKGLQMSRAEVEEIYSRIQVTGRDQCIHMGPPR